MRLTLRTLLAYIDDTLEPTQAKEIGLKVAESDVAQELIERIKAVTRRRGLTIPPASGPDRIDANTVSDYLDNDLAPEAISEVEELALNSDVHLAEIAACHQILTLVLGEPANVPPVARQRMYQLVRGPEADPSRRATRVAPPTEPGDSRSLREHQAARRGARLRLIGAGIIALAFGVAIWQAMTNVPRQNAPLPGEQRPVTGGETAALPTPPAEKGNPEPKPPENPNPPDKSGEPKPEPKPEPPKPPIDQPPDRKPSDQRTEIGTFATKDAILLARGADGPWTRIAPDARISTAAAMLTLPGYHDELKLDCGARLFLWGNMPEWIPAGILECQVTLFAPPDGFDLDLMLDRGRIYLVGGPKPIRARLRLASEIWDVTLADAGTEIVVDV